MDFIIKVTSRSKVVTGVPAITFTFQIVGK
jgi:hypothetical protein